MDAEEAQTEDRKSVWMHNGRSTDWMVFYATFKLTHELRTTQRMRKRIRLGLYLLLSVGTTDPCNESLSLAQTLKILCQIPQRCEVSSREGKGGKKPTNSLR